ncbi:hypothetical protein JFV29_14165 [Peribacillus sp. TH16]|uniref:hypothetical protein n=1 Tax=Peribacillus sp. TH16 TaxID=2798482 RepID=UPI001912F2EC|nr:hypothetical protein [Peribacillus sp. TH16]MBK5482989.1 hypothetical protein [Peribacillus sp. TH16]MBK5483015.1 hypothetical protein [Peribacillus sp. TH16]
MKVFNIKHDDQAMHIHLETTHTKFESLERLIMGAANEFIEKNKKDQLNTILGRIEAKML